MQIERAFACPGTSAYYFDDLAAIRAGAQQDGFFYPGEPLTAGHGAIRQAGESISLMLELEDGVVVHGDAVSIQYSGVVGREPVLRSDTYAPLFDQEVAPKLAGLELTTFRELGALVESLTTSQGSQLHTGLRYGLSQAVLAAIAHVNRELPAETVAREWDEQIRTTPVPVLAQSGDDRYVGVDKMILRRIPVIPQGLFNTIDKVGPDGERLLDYVTWLQDRIERFGAPGYHPTIHVDVYGLLTQVSRGSIQGAAEYLRRLEAAAGSYPLRVEHPFETGARDSMLAEMADLRRVLRAAGSSVELCADDWVNTLDDIRVCIAAEAADMIQIKAPDLGSLTNSIDAVGVSHDAGVKAFLGGTCNGTDQSSRMTVHAAMASNADQIYNKPGMGVDEGHMIVTNEMNRILAIRNSRSSSDLAPQRALQRSGTAAHGEQ